MTPTLAIENLRKTQGNVEILKGITLTLAQGEFLVLLGPSGSGKSTLLNLIAGLDATTSGTIRIDGREVDRIPPKDRDIAMVFQSYALYPSMTVARNLSFCLERRGIPKAEREAAVMRVAETLQIRDLLDRKPGRLSGGQRQRVAMGRAMVRNPRIFLFDEPLSNLDAKLRADMRAEIKRLHRHLGTTVVYVTHDQAEAMTLATRIAVLHDGTIQQCAPPQELYDCPANIYVAGFIGSPTMNFIPGLLTVADGRTGAIVGDGLFLPLPNAGDTLADRHGTEVILGIRPEAIYRLGDGIAAAHPSRIAVRCAVNALEPTGADVLVRLRLGDWDIVARLEPGQAPEPGEAAAFAIDTSRIIAFDPRTEARITACAAR
jgi:multiple sugar transport system ATP-binding protein